MSVLKALSASWLNLMDLVGVSTGCFLFFPRKSINFPALGSFGDRDVPRRLWLDVLEKRTEVLGAHHWPCFCFATVLRQVLSVGG